MRKILVLLVFVLALSSMIAGSNALGISPSRVIIDFQPDLQETREYTIINNEDKTKTVELYKKGDLANCITLYDTSYALSPGERKTFSYDIDLPDSLEGYGIFDTRIGAVESAPEGSMMGGRAAVESQLWIRKLFEGTYLELSILASDGYAGNIIPISLKITNYGTEDAACSGLLDIFYSDQNITEFEMSETVIASTGNTDFDIQWNTVDASAGEHTAKATLLCNTQEFT
ncbi:MAG: hypothetical protein ABIF08_01060, partial [Nanoarchaeota archaeon]